MIATLLFLLGVYLSIRTIAALYRILDLWYTIRTAWWRVLREVAGWAGAVVLIGVILPNEHRPAFVGGLGAYLGFYLLAGSLISYLLVPVIAAQLKPRSGARLDRQVTR